MVGVAGIGPGLMPDNCHRRIGAFLTDDGDKLRKPPADGLVLPLKAGRLLDRDDVPWFVLQSVEKCLLPGDDPLVVRT